VRLSKPNTLPKNSDLGFMTLAEQISRDYQEFLKLIVVPPLSERYGLKLREIRVLMCLEDVKSDLSATELADTLRQDPSTITRSLIALVRGDFIETHESVKDGRSKRINLLVKGQEAASLINDIIETELNEIDDEEGLAESLRSDAVYTERMLEVRERAKFVLNAAKGRT
jgi:DNA-binding MarR family transcriptional regulator